ncbi:MAG: sigma-70 family RNA polymerase sigma factor [Zavarzinella sp.]
MDQCTYHLQRTLQLYLAKNPHEVVTWPTYFDSLYVLDWYICNGCIENNNRAWEILFATRTGRSDTLLVDALRARAIRLYPRDEERQEGVIQEFWTHLLVANNPNSLPIMARYDGQRPLAPWLIRVFQNWHVSQMRSHHPTAALPDDDLALPIPQTQDDRWHDAFCSAARDWLNSLSDAEILLLGLRWRYRFSQRQIAQQLKVHEGTISRHTDALRDRCYQVIGQRLTSQGWTGDELETFILTEMQSLLMDEPRLAADQLTLLLAKKGIELPGEA